MSSSEQKQLTGTLSPEPAGPLPESSPENPGGCIFAGVSPGSRRLGDYLRTRRDWVPEKE